MWHSFPVIHLYAACDPSPLSIALGVTIVRQSIYVSNWGLLVAHCFYYEIKSDSRTCFYFGYSVISKEFCYFTKIIQYLLYPNICECFTKNNMSQILVIYLNWGVVCLFPLRLLYVPYLITYPNAQCCVSYVLPYVSSVIRHLSSQLYQPTKISISYTNYRYCKTSHPTLPIHPIHQQSTSNPHLKSPPPLHPRHSSPSPP